MRIRDVKPVCFFKEAKPCGSLIEKSDFLSGWFVGIWKRPNVQFCPSRCSPLGLTSVCRLVRTMFATRFKGTKLSFSFALTIKYLVINHRDAFFEDKKPALMQKCVSLPSFTGLVNCKKNFKCLWQEVKPCLEEKKSSGYHAK